jgi:hypothetical protein
MFFPDLPAALERIWAALGVGGRFAAAVWGPPERVPLIAVGMQTAARELELPPPAPGTPGPLSLADSDALEARLREAGFADVRSERMTVNVEFASASDYTQFMRAISAPINNLLADKPSGRQEEVWSAITRAAEAYASDDGSLSLPGEVINVLGRR